MSKFKGDLNRLGVKHSITKEQQEEILESFFDDLKMFITDPRMPKIRIQNFGTFRPLRGQISRSLSKSFWFRGIGQGNIDSLRKRVSRLWAIRQRLLKEEKIRGDYKHNFVFWHQRTYDWKELEKKEESKKLFGKHYYEQE